jgi:hypothetical protein
MFSQAFYTSVHVSLRFTQITVFYRVLTLIIVFPRVSTLVIVFPRVSTPIIVFPRVSTLIIVIPRVCVSSARSAAPPLKTHSSQRYQTAKCNRPHKA